MYSFLPTVATYLNLNKDQMGWLLVGMMFCSAVYTLSIVRLLTDIFPQRFVTTGFSMRESFLFNFFVLCSSSRKIIARDTFVFLEKKYGGKTFSNWFSYAFGYVGLPGIGSFVLTAFSAPVFGTFGAFDDSGIIIKILMPLIGIWVFSLVLTWIRLQSLFIARSGGHFDEKLYLKLFIPQLVWFLYFVVDGIIFSINN